METYKKYKEDLDKRFFIQKSKVRDIEDKIQELMQKKEQETMRLLEIKGAYNMIETLEREEKNQNKSNIHNHGTEI